MGLNERAPGREEAGASDEEEADVEQPLALSADSLVAVGEDDEDSRRIAGITPETVSNARAALRQVSLRYL
eukprot:642725-Rhodomonas_salina.3